MSRIKELKDAILTIDPAAEAIEFDGAWWTWGDLARVGAEIDAALVERGLGEGTRIAGIMRNRPEIAGGFAYVIGADRCLVTLNPSLPDEQLAGDIVQLAPPVIFGTAADLARGSVAKAIADIGCLVLTLPSERGHRVEVSGGAGLGNGALHMVSAPGTAIEMLTSGTTGKPKRVPLSQRALESSLLSAAAFEKGGERGRTLRRAVAIVNAPFAHIAGVFGFMNALLAGRRVALLPKFTVESWADAVFRHKPKVAGAPPAALRMILDANIPREKLASLSAYRTGTAPLDPDLADQFFERYGIPVLQNYSATEFAGSGAGWSLADFNEYGKAKRGSVGRINPPTEGRIVDQDSGAPLPAGAVGLLELRAAHLGDGSWVRTTDLAAIDDDGFLWIKGRADNAIIRGGFKVFPDDIIRAIETHPAILEAAVVAWPDERLGQIPVAAYLTVGGAAAPSDGELRAHLRGQLLSYQIPAHLVHLTELPRTPSLKVSQPALRKILESELHRVAA
ncbi:class I adenylate-forming enzyme family protein [Sphingomonas flavalba]|uniref:class I adenylate-forming enzyme family protein n=1 Tax=Sphingomonas flavalba TaxID=2559804 RepID=UPI0039DF9827